MSRSQPFNNYYRQLNLNERASAHRLQYFNSRDKTILAKKKNKLTKKR